MDRIERIAQTVPADHAGETVVLKRVTGDVEKLMDKLITKMVTAMVETEGA